MRKLLTIALWVACPMLSLASTVPGSFEDRAQAARGQGLDVIVPAVAQRPVSVAFHAPQGSNYSLSPASRATTGLKAPATGMTEPAADSFAAKARAEGETHATAPEADPAISTPIPEPQSYLLMMAGLAALAFMAARRGRS